jgi:hypothetical protein
MKRQHTLVLPEKVAEQLRRHLFPGDGLEAVALLLCAPTGERRKKLLGREIIAIFRHDQCGEKNRAAREGAGVKPGEARRASKRPTTRRRGSEHRIVEITHLGH